MLDPIIATFAHDFVIALLGGYGGYRYAIRGVQPASRPSGWWQLGISVMAGVGGTLLSVLFTLTLLYAFPNADAKHFETIVPLALGVGLGTVITQRRLKAR